MKQRCITSKECEIIITITSFRKDRDLHEKEWQNLKLCKEDLNIIHNCRKKSIVKLKKEFINQYDFMHKNRLGVVVDGCRYLCFLFSMLNITTLVTCDYLLEQKYPNESS